MGFIVSLYLFALYQNEQIQSESIHFIVSFLSILLLCLITSQSIANNQGSNNAIFEILSLGCLISRGGRCITENNAFITSTFDRMLISTC